MGRDIHHRSKPHCSSIRDTSRQRLPMSTASGCRSRPSRTTTGTGLDIDLISSLADESTGTRRPASPGPGARGQPPPPGTGQEIPPVRVRSSLSTSTSRTLVRLPGPRAAGPAESPTPQSSRSRVRVTSSTGPDGCSSSSRGLIIDKARFRLPTHPLEREFSWTRSGHPPRCTQDSALPAYRPRIEGREKALARRVSTTVRRSSRDAEEKGRRCARL